MDANKIDWATYNPWIKNDTLNKKIQEYIAFRDGKIEQDDFSWVIDDGLNSFKNTTIDDSIKYGLPNHSFGDLQAAKLFVCLFNPSTQKGYEKKAGEHQNGEDLSEYVKIEGGNENGEDFDSEIDFKLHVQNPTSVINKELNYLKEQYKLEQYPETGEERKKAYYLYSYFYPFFDSNRPKAFEKIKEIIQKDSIPGYPVANIELIPYRSKHKSDIKLTKNGLEELATAKYSASVVVNRIMLSMCSKDKDEDKPVFIFRSYTEWSRVISKFIEDEEAYITAVIDPDNYKKFKDTWKEYAFIFKNPQSAALHKSNIGKFLPIKNDEYIKINSIFDQMRLNCCNGFTEYSDFYS